MTSLTRLRLKRGPRPRRDRRQRRLRAIEQLEDRTLLSAVPGNDFTSAIPLGVPLDSRTGAMTPDAPVFFQLTPATDAFLEARVHAVGTLTRLALLDAQGRNLLVQSDGQSPTDPDDLIRQHLPAGTDYLELQSLGGVGSYTLTTSLTPQSQPGQPLSLNLGTNFESLTSTTSGDFNGDGLPDFAVATNADFESNQATVQVVLDNRDGTFTPQTPISLEGPPTFSVSLAAGDFDGDGRADLALTRIGVSSDRASVQILLGNGDGTFRPQSPVVVDGLAQPQPDEGNPPTVSIEPGDFNGDGRTDLILASYGGAEVELSDGGGMFHLQARVDLAIRADSVVVGDFNGDGRPDLVITSGSDFSDIHDKVEVLTGNGDGTFRPGTPIDPGFSTYNPFLAGDFNGVAGDFNGDGRTDLALDTPNRGSDFSSTLDVLLGNGDGTLQPESPVVLAGLGLVAGDFNGDGRTDLAVAEINPSTLQIMLGSSDGT
jgi:hypothetical protein